MIPDVVDSTLYGQLPLITDNSSQNSHELRKTKIILAKKQGGRRKSHNIEIDLTPEISR